MKTTASLLIKPFLNFCIPSSCEYVSVDFYKHDKLYYLTGKPITKNYVCSKDAHRC